MDKDTGNLLYWLPKRIRPCNLINDEIQIKTIKIITNGPNLSIDSNPTNICTEIASKIFYKKVAVAWVNYLRSLVPMKEWIVIIKSSTK